MPDSNIIATLLNIFYFYRKPNSIKKTITISFLLLLFFSQLGYQFIYAIRQADAKEEAKQKLLALIPEAALELIDAGANKNDIKWEEAGKEFYLHGQRFDIAKIKEVNGKTMLYCLNDKKEEQVLQDLSKSIQSASDQSANSKPGQHLVKFQIADFILDTQKIITTTYQPARQKHVGYIVAIANTIKEVNTPPPKFNINT